MLSAVSIAGRLAAHPDVAEVLYPGLPNHPQHELAKRQMRNFSGMMTFQTKEAGPAIAARMVKQLEIIHYAVSLGHHRSLIYWIGTDDIQASTFRHGPEQLRRYRLAVAAAHPGAPVHAAFLTGQGRLVPVE